MPWRWNRAKESLSEEFEAHLQIAIADRVDRGEDPVQARAEAMRELGNVPLIVEVTRERWGWLWLENLLHDAHYALRHLRRTPAFTVTALLTLALGIGANLGVFQLLYSVILADLPVAHPEEIVGVHAARTPFDQAWLVSNSAYLRLRASTPEVPLLARTTSVREDLELSNGVQEKPSCEMVSDNYFSVLGVVPAAGRFFIQAEAAQGQGEWPAVLRYDFARDTFGSAQQAVGQHMFLNGRPSVVIGVASRRFLGVVTGYASDIWLPLALQSTGGFDRAFDSLGPGHGVVLSKPWYNQPTIFWLSLMARVPERRAAVAAEWDRVFSPDRELMTEATADPAVKSALRRATTELAPLNHSPGGMRQRFSAPLVLLMALSASIFLVGCLNLANLQLARLNTRAHELGVRMALGASRGGILRQVVLEDVLIVLAGCASAFVMGRLATNILVRWASSHNSRITLDLHPGLPIAVLGVALMLLALLSFSILPAVFFMRTAAAQTAGSRAKVSGVSQTARQRWRSNALLATQVSLSLLLSTMSGCFAATLVHWETVDVGMDREHVLSVHLDMHQYRYVGDHRSSLPALYRRMQERLQALPDVRSAAVEVCGSLHCGWNTALYVYGRSDLTNGQVHGQENHVGPDFFSTIGIPILRGRDFSRGDTDKSQHVAIINRAYARQLFGDADPIGQWVGYQPAPNNHSFLIVGEVADARVNGPESEAPPIVYISIDQDPDPVNNIRVRAVGNPRHLSDSVRQALHEVDPTLPIVEIAPFSTELNGDLGTEKLLARLAGVYASLTLLLVAIGFYGVMSSRTTRRKKEFGIRLALGATRGHIQMLIVCQTGRILFAGILPGAILSILAVRAAGHILYGSVSTNAIAIIAASLVLAFAGSVATLIPARRAALADPLETLHSE